MKACIIYLVRQSDNAVKLQNKGLEIVPHVSPQNVYEDDVWIGRDYWLTDEPGTRCLIVLAVRPEVREQLIGVLKQMSAVEDSETALLDWRWIRYGDTHAGKTDAEIYALADAFVRATYAADKTWHIDQGTTIPTNIVPEFA